MTVAVDQSTTLSRRQLLFGRHQCLPAVIYPPWAIHITTHCSSCGECVSSCPQNIIKLNDSHFPVVNFNTNECSFCQACVNACKEKVFDLTAPPWSLQITFDDACFLKRDVYCRTCGDNCPEGAIHFSLQSGNKTVLNLDNDTCTGCGACVSSCPVSAVHIAPETTSVEFTAS